MKRSIKKQVNRSRGSSMYKSEFSVASTARTPLLSLLITIVALGSEANGRQFDGPTQVVTVYFAGTLLKSDTVFHFGGRGPKGDQSVPELLQYLYHDQDVSAPNQHKIWVDGIGDMAKHGFLSGVFDAGLAARHANNCKIDSYPTDPWDPRKKTIRFRSAWGVHLAGFECWDYRLHEALDTNKEKDLFKIMSANPNSPIILNILGHSRGGILAMMLAHKVSKLQRRYHSKGDLVAEYEKFKKINIITFDPVPGNPDEIGLYDETTQKFVKSHEYFNLSPRVSNYVGFYAKDERQNIFEAVIPHHSPETKVWLLALNGAHQTLVGNPRKDGHEYDKSTSQDFSGRGLSSQLDESASDVAKVTNIIARELLKTKEWGSVKFHTNWRFGGNYHSRDPCKNEQECERYFLDKYQSQAKMPMDTRALMRSVAHPGYTVKIPPFDIPIDGIISEGGLQAYSYSYFLCGPRVTKRGKQLNGYQSWGDEPHYFADDREYGKCTFKAINYGKRTVLHSVPLIEKPSPHKYDNSGITDKSAVEVCKKLVELTNLHWKWNCK